MKPLRVPAGGFTGLMRGGQLGRRVAIGYPVGGSVTEPFMASMSMLQKYESDKGRECLLSNIMKTRGLYVADNRQLLTQRFLQQDADWLLQIDTDIEFPPNLIELMLAHTGPDQKIVAANVPLGAPWVDGSFPSVAFHQGADPWTWICLPSPLPEPIQEVDAVATAVIIIHREVFETIAARHGQCWFNHLYLPASPEGTPKRDFRYRSIGEDIAFCLRAKEAGFKVWAARVPGLRHHKSCPLSEDFMSAGTEPVTPSAVGELVLED